jgi:hypothetical protein
MEITRAISVRQPYAELIMLGVKTEEFRSIPTKIRERIYVYASNTLADDDSSLKRTKKTASELPRGFLIGTIEIVDCSGSKERGFVWKLKDPIRLETPIRPTKKPQPVWFKPF